MKLFFITYDAADDGENNELLDKLRSLGAKRVLQYVWAVKGDYTADQLRNVLRGCLGSNEGLLVIEERDWSGLRTLIDINKV